jgi:F-box protein 11
VHVHDNGQGTLEDNEIFGNGLGEVQIGRAGNPTMRRNRVHDSKVGSGVIVYEGGQGILEDNDIFSNTLSGISARHGGQPVVTNNRINKNASFGIRIYANGGGTFKNNHLTENVKGAWSISESSKANVTHVNNKE